MQLSSGRLTLAATALTGPALNITADQVTIANLAFANARHHAITIQPGAIVKFAKKTGITVQAGGILNALAADGTPIQLTSLADDAAGGDTNLDGNNSRPQPGDWTGVAVIGNGQFNQTAAPFCRCF